jgi:anti-sigma-K factor RskA
MRYDNPELIDILSAEYVLGTLKGGARRRFEQLCLNKPTWMESNRWWEKQLHLLIDTIPETTPNNRVWIKINNQLFKKSQPKSIWLDFAKLISVAMFASIATFLIVESPKDDKFENYQAVAILSSSAIGSGWHLNLVKMNDGSAKLNVYSLFELVQRPTASYELWLLPENSGKPISLGLLTQQGKQELLINANLTKNIKNSQLAVSIEPIGGSPTGQPTGDVVYQGTFLNIKKGLSS